MNGNSAKAVLDKAIEYMKENVEKKLRVDHIEAYCGVSRSWLEKIFGKFTERGVMRYFLDLKLEHATKLLKQGKTVGEIAKQLHFSSIAHFSMAFKKKYGVSPLRYKYPSITDFK